MSNPWESEEAAYLRKAFLEGQRCAEKAFDEWIKSMVGPIPTLKVDKVCPKCGGKTTRVWHLNADDCRAHAWTRYKQSSHEEHLHYFCTECGYDWTGKTIEQQTKGPTT